jgi:hypothetical protein
MYCTIRIMNVLGWVRGDIILAIGDIFLHRRENAFRLGFLIHVGTSLLFAPFYLLILSTIGFVTVPDVLIAGGFFGLLHGLFVSLALVWVSSNEPMLPEFSGARLPLGVMHCVGHIAYGISVAAVIAAVVEA